MRIKLTISKLELFMNELTYAGAKRFPLLGKGGVAARINKMMRSHLSSRADGVVRSTTDYRMLTQPPRPLPCSVASRHFYWWSRPPLLCQGGEPRFAACA